MRYTLSIPGKPDKILDEKDFDITKFIDRVESLGGTITPIAEPIPEPKPLPKYVPYTPQERMEERIQHYSSSVGVMAKADKIIEEIKQKYFPKELWNIPVEFCIISGKKTLGLANTVRKTIRLNYSLLNNDNTLKQVVYHEMCHIQFPQDGHRGFNFRKKEYNNPFRTRCSTRLTCVS